MDKMKKLKIRHFTLLRWIRGLIPAFFIFLLFIITSSVLLVITVGFPSPVLRFAEKELEKNGIYMSVGRVRLDFFDGFALVARNIKLYEQPKDQGYLPVLSVARAKLDFTIDNISSGNFNLDDLNKLEIKGASLSLPIEKPDSTKTPPATNIPSINVDDITGEIVLQSEGIIDLDNASWEIGGIRFNAKGRVLVDLQEKVEEAIEAAETALVVAPPSVDHLPGVLDAVFFSLRTHKDNILEGMSIRDDILFPEDTPPEVDIVFEINTEKMDSSRATVSILSPVLEVRGYKVNNIEFKADYQLGLFSIDKLFFRDEYGHLHWEGYYNIYNKLVVGRLNSTILWEPFKECFFDYLTIPYGIGFPYPIGASAHVRLELDENGHIKDYKASGQVSSRNISAAGLLIRNLSADFSLDNGSYYVDNLNLDFGSYSLTGRSLYKDNQLKLALKSNVPLESYLTLIKEIGSDFSLPEDLTVSGIPTYDTELQIIFPSDDKGVMQVNGYVDFDCEQLKYKEYDIKGAQVKVRLDELQIPPDYKNIQAKGGKVDLICRELSGAGVILKSLELNTAFDRLKLQEAEMPLSVVNGFVHLGSNEMYYMGVGFNKVVLDLYYKDGEAYVPNFAATTAKEKELRASAVIKDKILTAKIYSTLLLNEIAKLSEHPEAHRHDQKLAFDKNGFLEVETDIRINIDGWNDYLITGKASGRNARYNGVPLESARAEFKYIPKELTLSNIQLVIPYTGYKTKVSPSPSKATFTAKNIINDEKKSTIKIVNLSGRGYPERIVRMFAGDHIANEVEKFVFYQPPTLSANGTIDISAPNMDSTNFRVNFSGNRVDYSFLDKPLNLTQVSGEVHINGQKLHLNGLKGKIWSGNFEAQLGIKIVGSSGYNGSFMFDKCNLKEVARTYGVQFEDEDAWVNATFDFEMPGSTLNHLKGNGKVELTDGNLMFIPFFGPLSTLLNDVFKFIPGFSDLVRSQIRQASCDFEIRKGILMTDNFIAKGGNLNIRGSGNIDLSKTYLNMDVRVDLKSLIGLLVNIVTMPTLPFGGLFSFHGEGPLDNTSWSIRPFSEDYKGN